MRHRLLPLDQVLAPLLSITWAYAGSALSDMHAINGGTEDEIEMLQAMPLYSPCSNCRLL